MRLDKFLKVSRIIKRRTLAKEICDAGRVLLNGRQAKASSEVAPGDRMELHLGSRRLVAEVLSTPATIPADRAKETYQVLEDTRNSQT
jgi:ribosomal 50S subunit-recycling heat shock protein